MIVKFIAGTIFIYSTVKDKEQRMSETCSICGATWEGDLTCQNAFDEFLALEFRNAAYGRVHMLTVACFMIQHQRYSNPALAWMQQNLCDALENGISPTDIRTQMASTVDQKKRGWKVKHQPDEPKLPHIDWSITIAEVHPHKDDPTSYCTWVEHWAKATLEEMRF